MFKPAVSTPANASADDKQARRLEAVLALLGGESASQVATRFSICRSDLYKFRRRALSAIAGALEDHKRGPHLPHNHLSQPQQVRVAALCARYPTASSYQTISPDGCDRSERTHHPKSAPAVTTATLT